MDLKRIADEAKNGVVETYYENGHIKHNNMNTELRKSFSQLKSKCQTKSQRVAFNALIKTFNVKTFGVKIKNFDLVKASEVYEETYDKEIQKKIAKLLGGNPNKLYIIDDEAGTYLTKDTWNQFLDEEPTSISEPIDLGTKGDMWYGVGELITMKSGDKLFCWHDSGNFAIIYLLK